MDGCGSDNYFEHILHSSKCVAMTSIIIISDPTNAKMASPR